jgi:hypothetical protein
MREKQSQEEFKTMLSKQEQMQKLRDAFKPESKFDWATRNYKIRDGRQRVRILPNPDPNELDVLHDYYVKVSNDLYVDCQDRDCDLIRNIKRIWDTKSSTRQAIYRSIKPIDRFQVQVVELSDDGSRVMNATPRMLALPKTVFKQLLDTCDGDLTSHDLVVERHGTGSATDYSGTGWLDAVTSLDREIGDPLPLDANRNYGNKKWIEPLNEIMKSVGLSLELSEA